MKHRMLAIGIVVGLAIAGCIGAVTYQADSPRYVAINENVYTILDTQTGTVNIHDSSGGVWTTIVLPFQDQ